MKTTKFSELNLEEVKDIDIKKDAILIYSEKEDKIAKVELSVLFDKIKESFKDKKK